MASLLEPAPRAQCSSSGRSPTDRHASWTPSHFRLASEHEAIRQQRIRDLEVKAILEAIAGSGGQAGAETLGAPETTALVALAPIKTVDFASLTAFEEFH